MKDSSDFPYRSDLAKRLVFVFSRAVLRKPVQHRLQFFRRLLHTHSIDLQNADTRGSFKLLSDRNRLEHEDSSKRRVITVAPAHFELFVCSGDSNLPVSSIPLRVGRTVGQCVLGPEFLADLQE